MNLLFAGFLSTLIFGKKRLKTSDWSCFKSLYKIKNTRLIKRFYLFYLKMRVDKKTTKDKFIRFFGPPDRTSALPFTRHGAHLCSDSEFLCSDSEFLMTAWAKALMRRRRKRRSIEMIDILYSLHNYSKRRE